MEATFARAKAANRCASWSCERSIRFTRDLTPADENVGITALQLNLRPWELRKDLPPFLTIFSWRDWCVERSAKPKATSRCSRGLLTLRPRAINVSNTFDILPFYRGASGVEIYCAADFQKSPWRKEVGGGGAGGRQMILIVPVSGEGWAEVGGGIPAWEKTGADGENFEVGRWVVGRGWGVLVRVVRVSKRQSFFLFDTEVVLRVTLRESKNERRKSTKEENQRQPPCLTLRTIFKKTRRLSLIFFVHWFSSFIFTLSQSQPLLP